MKKFLCALMCLVVAATAFADTRGDEIARAYFGLATATDTSAQAVMTLLDKSGAKKTRKLSIYYKEGAEGRSAYIVFSEPADVAGTKFLTIAHRGAEPEQRLYLPALKKARKISASNKDGEFVNSDFFYYDLEDRSFDDCTYTLLSENETIADKALDGMKFYKLEMKPKDPAAPYAKSIAYVNMADNFVYRLDCFDKKDGALLKTILFVKVELVKGVLVPTQTLVTNVKKGTKTLLAMSGVAVNTGLKDDLFSVKNLEQ